ncbi:MAG TPA: tRNA lysidine(34) synthetase TilS [Solirubrobacteraceae bacterium]|jgi:tRNA(Ile)-lysidine synthase|nr:tRNA lysidine(34) synthetase TilS [Solirubrobacteraceae bacterium]
MVCEDVRQAVAGSGLFARDRPVIAMLSGGRDSSCLLDVAVALLGAASLSALHVNYGLRADADGDEQHCLALCEQLGVELHLVRAGPAPGGQSLDRAATDCLDAEISAREDHPTGNLQAWARDLRYAEAMRLAEQRDALFATGHTADDQLETILYRLAASPGRRALLGMPASEGRLIRPLLGVTREQTSAYCQARALAWRDDESNQDERYARARVRRRLIPALRTVHPAAAANVLRTASLLREETELLEGLVTAELAGRRSIELARLGELPSALARLVVVRLAEEAVGTYVPQAGERVQEIIALGRRGGRAELHVGGQAGAVIHDGMLEMIKLAPRE